MRARTILIFAGLALATLARGEAVSPDRSGAMGSVIHWLTSAEAPRPDFSSDATARSFETGPAVALSDLAGRFIGHRVLAMLVYPHPPTTVAGDLSKQLSHISDVPASALAPLLVNGDLVRADRIAATWIRDCLSPAATDSVGVCVLWGSDADADASSASNGSGDPKLTLVLVKFRSTTSATPQIDRIVFGQPAALAK